MNRSFLTVKKAVDKAEIMKIISSLNISSFMTTEQMCDHLASEEVDLEWWIFGQLLFWRSRITDLFKLSFAMMLFTLDKYYK